MWASFGCKRLAYVAGLATMVRCIDTTNLLAGLKKTPATVTYSCITGPFQNTRTHLLHMTPHLTLFKPKYIV